MGGKGGGAKNQQNKYGQSYRMRRPKPGANTNDRWRL